MRTINTTHFTRNGALHGTQARRGVAPYPRRVTDEETRDTMHYWLARAAKEARLAKDRKQVHVAAAMSSDQSTVNRFEQAKFGWPRNPDVTVAAYADDLDLSPIDLWDRAAAMWREAGGEWATVAELLERKHDDDADDAP